MSAALSLKNKGLADKDILAVVTSVEATLPFNEADRMEGLRTRIEKLVRGNPSFGIDVDTPQGVREIDKIVANATLLANRDVIGMIGGLKPGQEVTADHIRNIMVGTDNLHPEEVPALRVDAPGLYPASELMRATNKQYSLFAGVLAPDSTKQILHSVKIQSTDFDYPPKEELEKYSELGREVATFMAVVMKTRVAVTGMISALAKQEGLGEANLGDLLKHITLPQPDDKSLRRMSRKEEVAAELLAEDRNVGQHDTPRSKLAALLIEAVGTEGLDTIVGTHPFKNSNITKMFNKAPEDAEKAAADYVKTAREVAPSIVDALEQSIKIAKTRQPTNKSVSSIHVTPIASPIGTGEPSQTWTKAVTANATASPTGKGETQETWTNAVTTDDGMGAGLGKS